MTETPAQKKAITAKGNVLVVAGAGTGKTRTLVQCCLSWLLDEKPPGSLDEILMVTFTEAAAAEMRRRLREELEKKFSATSEARVAEQLALLDTARICTLHSFCLQLIREHFHELSLDPQLSVLPEEQAQLLARETLDAILEKHYRGETPTAAAVQELIQQEGRGWDQPVRELVARIHAYTQTLPDPDAWFQSQLGYFQSSTPQHWEEWLVEALVEWRDLSLPLLQSQPAENFNARQCVEELKKLQVKTSRENFAAALQQIRKIDEADVWPKGKKTILRARMNNFYGEAEFFSGLCCVGASDPLLEDWNWVRPQMQALLQLVQEFDREYSDAKRQLGGVDFHDLEQFALDVLWDRKRNSPTAIAGRWREKIRRVFVDEYQDINAAQDAIICALGRGGEDANRFLVGDVKQSIYRFRLANPRIFLRYQKEWNSAAVGVQALACPGSLKAELQQVIPLSHNFRSHEAILNFVNPLFTSLMRKELGGVDYNEDAKLQFGNREGRTALTVALDPTMRVELHLRFADDDGEAAGDEDEENSNWQSLSIAEKEARLIAARLSEIKTSAFVREKTEQRPAKWSDMVILLRSPRSKAEAFAREFARAGVPLAAARGGFYESIEVSDLLNLLRLLDNPLQDMPLLAVLRSPLVGLSADELALVRMANRNGNFWTALVKWQEEVQSPKAKVQNPDLAGAQPAMGISLCKITQFLNRFYAWRRGMRQMSLSHLLENILDETHYADWLLAQERGAQQRANVERLLQLTRQFDALQGEGLFRFLKLVEAQQESEIDIEPAATEGADAVRLMSIHQSKGLEFPIVVVADLAKGFNFSDANANVILDEEFGLCPRIRPPHTQQRYPSLPHWLAQRREKRETLGEELRLLYVGLTRASERLVLVGTTRGKTVEKKWPALARGKSGALEISSGGSFLDWIGAWMAQRHEAEELLVSGKDSLLSWTIHEGEVDAKKKLIEASEDFQSRQTTAEELERLRARLEWNYPQESAAIEPAKTSVSALRRRVREENEDEAKPMFGKLQRSPFKTTWPGSGKLSATEIGSAHHLFLELVSLQQVGSAESLRTEAARLQEENLLRAEETASLDFEALSAFWRSAEAKKILEHQENIRRELPFTAKFSAADLAKINLQAGLNVGADEFIIVQGVIDLAVLLPKEIWLLDFKTDQIAASQVEEKRKLYESQLALYAAAISAIYHRPVTQCWLHFLDRKKTVPVDLRK